MLMGAARNALRAFNARVSLTCLYVVAHKLPYLFYGLVFVAHLFRRGPVLRTCNRFLGAPADRLGTDRMYPSALYCTGGLPPGFLCQRAWNFIAGPLEQGKGEKHAPQVLGRQHLKARYDAVDQLRFQPEPHTFIDIQVCIPVAWYKR